MHSSILMFSLSGFSIFLGFIALFFQKTYIDSKTNQITEIDIPIMGKMKTNYPALIFVFLGGFLAFYAFYKSPQSPQKIPWEITGSFKANDKIDWQDGTLRVFPTDFEVTANPDGTFKITASLEEGRTFEDVVQRIDYSHHYGSIQIYPQAEYNAYRAQKDTLIKIATKNSREYKQVPLQEFSEN